MADTRQEGLNSLIVSPGARLEFIAYLKDIVDWNSPDGAIRTGGSASLVATMFDVFEIDKGAQHLVGMLILPEEKFTLDLFATTFSRFISAYQEEDRHLDKLHLQPIPDDLIEAAEALVGCLEGH